MVLFLSGVPCWCVFRAGVGVFPVGGGIHSAGVGVFPADVGVFPVGGGIHSAGVSSLLVSMHPGAYSQPDTKAGDTRGSSVWRRSRVRIEVSG